MRDTLTPEIAREALNKMTDIIADDNYFTVEAALTAWEAQSELIDSQAKQIDAIPALNAVILAQAKEITKITEYRDEWQRRGLKAAHDYVGIKKQLELAVKALERCLIGGNSLASILIGFDLPHGWQEWTYEEASKSIYAHYPLDQDAAYQRYEIWLSWKTLREQESVLESINTLGGRDTP